MARCNDVLEVWVPSSASRGSSHCSSQLDYPNSFTIHFYSEDSKWTYFDTSLAMQKHSHSEINLECVDRMLGQSFFSLSSWPNNLEGSRLFIRIRMSKALRILYFHLIYLMSSRKPLGIMNSAWSVWPFRVEGECKISNFSISIVFNRWLIDILFFYVCSMYNSNIPLSSCFTEALIKEINH